MESRTSLLQKIFFSVNSSIRFTLRVNMTLLVSPEIGVPLSPHIPYTDLRERVEAACNTALELSEHGLDLEITDEDKSVANTLTAAYAQNPEDTSKKVTNTRAAKLRPASLVLANNILEEFGQAVVENSMHIRHLVTNKLLIETENPDPRIRLRALECLGKLSDVGLFAEKTEVTVTHQTTDELRQQLRQKLEKIVRPVEDIEDAVVLDGEPIDVDKELGDFDDE